MKISDMRGFAQGLLNESVLTANENEEKLTAADEQLINETLTEFFPMIIADEILSESFESSKAMDIINEAIVDLTGYMTGQGLINESTVSINNPKINFVRLNKDAQINRLKKIFTVKLARKANNKDYKKWKMGIAIKKKGMLAMDRVYGTKAMQLAKKAWQMSKSHSKINLSTGAAKGKLAK